MLYDCAAASCTLSSRQPSSIWVFAGSTSTSMQRRHSEHALRPQKSTHRLAIADICRTSHHDVKISPGWWGWEVHAHPPFSLLPSRRKLQCRSCWEADTLPVFHPLPYMYSVFTTVPRRVSDHDLFCIWIWIRINCQKKWKKLLFYIFQTNQIISPLLFYLRRTVPTGTYVIPWYSSFLDKKDGN